MEGSESSDAVLNRWQSLYDGDDLTQFPSQPVLYFQQWFSLATAHPNIPAPEQTTLCTASAKGIPSGRMVLLKGVDLRGFCFYTNYLSRKGNELAENPYAALVFYWEPLGASVRVEGPVTRLSPEESDTYFDTRPRGSKLGLLLEKKMEGSESSDAVLNRWQSLYDGDDLTQFPSQPVLYFQQWFSLATAHPNIPAPEQTTLCTASAKGIPSGRMVLLKGVDLRGFCFYTNYLSRKGNELAENPYAALVFYWEPLGASVRVEGPVTRLSPEESDTYFDTRPRGSKLACIASDIQSAVVKGGKAELDDRYQATEDRYKETPDGEIPRPAHWGGYRVSPTTIEFWRAHKYRFHSRLRYTLKQQTVPVEPAGSEEGGLEWHLERLAP
eukprot:TRINITY_DN757_c0_g1_i1.p1 TRINITY_DN757_c0_g1~~TRINITY_DN757_c0_g1_i1.p1  ORF type:complete len:404 (+),score=63.55 TRINITY_DN757_c0_g1_i1:61-1212(+)